MRETPGKRIARNPQTKIGIALVAPREDGGRTRMTMTGNVLAENPPVNGGKKEWSGPNESLVSARIRLHRGS